MLKDPVENMDTNRWRISGKEWKLVFKVYKNYFFNVEMLKIKK